MSKSRIATPQDYAHPLKDLADIHFLNAKKIVLVQDNLNTLTKASLYEALSAAEARRLAERFERHYTPMYGSWPIWRSPNWVSFRPSAYCFRDGLKDAPPVGDVPEYVLPDENKLCYFRPNNASSTRVEARIKTAHFIRLIFSSAEN